MKFAYDELDPTAVDVAPARERGLKLQWGLASTAAGRRSREGAWIEIIQRKNRNVVMAGRSREGAWIEIGYC